MLGEVGEPGEVGDVAVPPVVGDVNAPPVGVVPVVLAALVVLLEVVVSLSTISWSCGPPTESRPHSS